MPPPLCARSDLHASRVRSLRRERMPLGNLDCWIKHYGVVKRKEKEKKKSEKRD